MHRLRQVSAALFLALVAATAVLPLAASTAARHGCHCPVKMQCCEDGTCTMGGDEAPADGPEWRTCRRDAPAVQAGPLDAFERASLKRGFFEGRERTASSRLADLAATRPRYGAPVPAAPPPR
jgi:hypothetical protein